MAYPRSPYDKEGGLVYFLRMLDKIHLKRRRELPEEYFPTQGRGFDGNYCQFLGVRFDDVVLKVQEGLSDPEILQWCFKAGGPKSDYEILLWNSFAIKKGWRDEDPATLERLKKYKQSSGLEHRDDFLTVFDYIEVDEGRRK